MFYYIPLKFYLVLLKIKNGAEVTRGWGESWADVTRAEVAGAEVVGAEVTGGRSD